MQEMTDKLIMEQIKAFTWYAPVNFGNGIIARGNHLADTDPLDVEFGLGKWNYILQRNLPDLQGKRVLDLGCNAGLFCIQMARLGAREIIGVDSDLHWKNWKEQAEFVRQALEWRCRTSYPIRYVDAELQEVPSLSLGNFDVVIALCCIYYLEDREIEALLRYLRGNAQLVLLQGNTHKGEQSQAVYRRSTPRYLSDMMRKCGYRHVWTDTPLLYRRPVIVGAEEMLPRPQRRFLSRSGIRDFIRNHI